MEDTRISEGEQGAPLEFVRALLTLRDVEIDRSLTYREIPAPTALSPYSAAIEVRVASTSSSPSSARATLVVLYDPEQEDIWGLPLRLVGQARIDVDEEQSTDPVLSEVIWSTFISSIEESGGSTWNSVGTVTREISETFGGLELQASKLAVELRCSWTPDSFDLKPHLEGWAEALRLNAGIRAEGTRRPEAISG